MSKYEKYDDFIIEKQKEGMNNKQIGCLLGIDGRRVSDRLRKNGLSASERRFNDNPNEDERLIFNSLFLGDGCIYKSNGNINYRINLAHSMKQKDYFMMKYNRIKDFIGTECFEETQTHIKYKKEYSCIKFQSLVNPFFTKMYSKWYKDGKKIVPIDIEELLSEELLALKYFDDGSLKGVGYSISMNDYKKEDVIRLSDAIRNNFGISCNYHNNYKVLYIPSKYRNQFRNIIEKYATPSVLYKLGEFSGTLNSKEKDNTDPSHQGIDGRCND